MQTALLAHVLHVHKELILTKVAFLLAIHAHQVLFQALLVLQVANIANQEATQTNCNLLTAHRAIWDSIVTL